MSEDIGKREPDSRAAISSAEGAGVMVFAQVARLELDELLEQLVSRAHDVQDSQGRLRGLLRAYLAVARADDLDVVLGHIVEAARELVDAGYAALGVVSLDSREAPDSPDSGVEPGFCVAPVQVRGSHLG